MLIVTDSTAGSGVPVGSRRQLYFCLGTKVDIAFLKRRLVGLPAISPGVVASVDRHRHSMPFTLAHVAAVLPFRRCHLIWSAFIVGSMAPDFPYILGSVAGRDFAHRMPGLLLFTLPASFAALWLFHNVIKRPVVGLFPTAPQAKLRDEMGPFRFGGARRFLEIFLTIVGGIATHLIWDGLTHSRSWFWYHIAFLRGRLHIPYGTSVSMTAAGQYISTGVGMLALVIWIVLWYRRTDSPAAPPARAVAKSRLPLAVTMVGIAAAAGFIHAAWLVGTPTTFHTADYFMFVFAVTTMAATFWQLLVYCVLVSSHQVWALS